MHPILLYLLKMLLCSGILYGYYRVALYNERFHQWNRFYLLASLLLSIIVPFLEIPLIAEEQPVGLVYIIETFPTVVVSKAAPLFTTESIIWMVSLLISLILLLRLMMGMFKTLYKPYREGQITTLNEVSIILTEAQSAPYSFFKWLFWRSDMEPDSPHGKRVLEHELTHIREMHSVDKLMMECLLIVCWFNPFFWLIKKELYVIHEFLADRKAIAHNDGAAFAEMILNTMNSGYPSAVANPFFSSQLKRRLKMITSSNKAQYSYLRRISGLVAMTGISLLLMLTIEKSMAQQVPPPPPPPAVAPPPPMAALTDTIKSIEVNTVNGKSIVTVKLTNGIVRKMPVNEAIEKGYPVPPPPPPLAIKDIKPHEIESITIDEEKYHAWVKLKDKTFFDLPLLDAQCLIEASPEKVVRKLTVKVPATEDPMYVYAGLEITKAQMEKLEPAMIESIDVLKGETAMAIYGEKGRTGLIDITPKLKPYKPFSPENIPTNIELADITPIRGAWGQGIEYKNLKRVQGYRYTPEESAAVQASGEPVTLHPGITIKDVTGVTERKKYAAIAAQGVEATQPGSANNPSNIFTEIEEPPMFPGGEKEWVRYLAKQLKLPEEARKDNISGVVRVQFVVDASGNISEVEALDNPGGGLAKEAIRVIENGPKWKPGEQNGVKVKSRIIQSVEFKEEILRK